MRRQAAILLLTALALCGCTRYRHMTAFTKKEGVRLEIDGKSYFRYEPATCQMSWSEARCEFRAGTDDMSDWFCASFEAAPASEGQELTADLSWSTPTGIVSKKAIALQVMKLEGDMVWLWTAEGQYALVIRILD